LRHRVEESYISLAMFKTRGWDAEAQGQCAFKLRLYLPGGLGLQVPVSHDFPKCFYHQHRTGSFYHPDLRYSELIETLS